MFIFLTLHYKTLDFVRLKYLLMVIFRTARNTVITSGLEVYYSEISHDFSLNHTKINHMYILPTYSLKINITLSKLNSFSLNLGYQYYIYYLIILLYYCITVIFWMSQTRHTWKLHRTALQHLHLQKTSRMRLDDDWLSDSQTRFAGKIIQMWGQKKWL